MNESSKEFLMTYGWAILIVLIAIGALAYFGVFNKFIPCECDGCHISFYNPTNDESEENYIDIECCYESYKDDFNQCQKLMQVSRLKITNYERHNSGVAQN